MCCKHSTATVSSVGDRAAQWAVLVSRLVQSLGDSVINRHTAARRSWTAQKPTHSSSTCQSKQHTSHISFTVLQCNQNCKELSLSLVHRSPRTVGYILMDPFLTATQSHNGGGFLRVKWPNQQCQSTEGRWILRIRLQCHHVHPTMLTIIQLCSMK